MAMVEHTMYLHRQKMGITLSRAALGQVPHPDVCELRGVHMWPPNLCSHLGAHICICADNGGAGQGTRNLLNWTHAWPWEQKPGEGASAGGLPHGSAAGNHLIAHVHGLNHVHGLKRRPCPTGPEDPSIHCATSLRPTDLYRLGG